MGANTDAALGRVLGVSAPTVANWKRRGRIPEGEAGALPGFVVEKVATYSRELPQVKHGAREAVLKLLQLTDGNPLEVRRAPIAATAMALPGLLALAQLLEDLSRESGAETSTEGVAELMQTGMHLFRHGDQFRSWDG